MALHLYCSKFIKILWLALHETKGGGGGSNPSRSTFRNIIEIFWERWQSGCMLDLRYLYFLEVCDNWQSDALEKRWPVMSWLGGSSPSASAYKFIVVEQSYFNKMGKLLPFRLVGSNPTLVTKYIKQLRDGGIW